MMLEQQNILHECKGQMITAICVIILLINININDSYLNQQLQKITMIMNNNTSNKICNRSKNKNTIKIW